MHFSPYKFGIARDKTRLRREGRHAGDGFRRHLAGWCLFFLEVSFDAKGKGHRRWQSSGWRRRFATGQRSAGIARLRRTSRRVSLALQFKGRQRGGGTPPSPPHGSPWPPTGSPPMRQDGSRVLFLGQPDTHPPIPTKALQ
jgi:hypothetical protein